MFKKTIFGSLFAGSCVVLGHSYYYKNTNKNKNLNNYYEYYYKDHINKCYFLNDDMKKKLIKLLD